MGAKRYHQLQRTDDHVIEQADAVTRITLELTVRTLEGLRNNQQCTLLALLDFRYSYGWEILQEVIIVISIIATSGTCQKQTVHLVKSSYILGRSHADHFLNWLIKPLVEGSWASTASALSNSVPMALAKTLPNSTPHWSNELMFQMAPSTKVTCS